VTLQINGNTVFSDIGRHNTTDNRTLFAKPIQMGGNLTFPFIGKLTDLNVWNGSIFDTEMSDFASCAFTDVYSAYASMPFQWSNIRLEIRNNTNMKFNVTLDGTCSDVTSAKLILFHKPVTFDQAFGITKQLNGEMYLPANQAELTRAFKIDYAKLKLSCLNSFWLPIVRSPTNETIWLNRSNITEQVTYLNWMTGQPNGYPSQNCITAEQGGYSDTECNDKRCFMGLFKKSPIFHLRGQYTYNPAVDDLYIFKFELIASSVYKFQGFSGLSDIIGNFDGYSWRLITYNKTTDTSDYIGSLSDVSKFPFGTRIWYYYTVGSFQMKISKVKI
jgi:hypothetical protein